MQKSLLEGSAGTGKTFCIRELPNRMKGRIVYTAPTNKATKELAKSLNLKSEEGALVGDVISGEYSTSSDFTSPTAFSDTLDLTEVGNFQVVITISDLTAGTYYFRAKHTRVTPAAQSGWSNTLTITMAAAGGTAVLFTMLQAA